MKKTKNKKTRYSMTSFWLESDVVFTSVLSVGLHAVYLYFIIACRILNHAKLCKTKAAY